MQSTAPTSPKILATIGSSAELQRPSVCLSFLGQAVEPALPYVGNFSLRTMSVRLSSTSGLGLHCSQLSQSWIGVGFFDFDLKAQI